MLDSAQGSFAPPAWAREVRATLSLAAPIVLTNVAQLALGTTDIIMMGWLGPDPLAAGALAVNLNWALLVFAIGVITATSPMMAHELGRNRRSVREVRRTVRQGLWTAAVLAVPLWVVLWQAEAILRAIGEQPALARAAAGYLHTYQWSILPLLIYLVLRNFVAALERPLSALWISGAAVAFNALSVWALMFGELGLPRLGLPGAGVGTTLSALFMALGLAALILGDRRFRRYHLFGRWWRPDWQRFREIWRIGLPIGGAMAFEVTVFNAAAFIMGLISPAAVAAYAIAIQIPSLIFMVPQGLGMAATVRVGLAYGAANRPGIARAGWTAYGLALAFACLTAALLLSVPRLLVGIFLNLAAPENQEVIALAVAFLFYAGLFQFVDAAQAVLNGMLRGLADTRAPMVICGIGYWGIGLPLGVALAFPAHWKGAGIWVGLATGLAVVAVLLTLRWIVRERRLPGLGGEAGLAIAMAAPAQGAAAVAAPLEAARSTGPT
jgi:MATE family multidrug resistance protein